MENREVQKLLQADKKGKKQCITFPFMQDSAGLSEVKPSLVCLGSSLPKAPPAPAPRPSCPLCAPRGNHLSHPSHLVTGETSFLSAGELPDCRDVS